MRGGAILAAVASEDMLLLFVIIGSRGELTGVALVAEFKRTKGPSKTTVFGVSIKKSFR
jgi:hypothetical protein